MTSASNWTTSVVIPARDAERYLAETLESILAQTIAVHEVIVVDDGSVDSTPAIAASFGDPVRVVSIPASGIGSARNAGVEAAAGDLIAFCDSDDLWLPTKLEKQLALIGDLSEAAVVFCGMDEFWSPELEPAARVGREPQVDVLMARLSSMALLTRAALEVGGPFLDGVSVGEWVTWCISLSDRVDVRNVPEPLCRRRLHDRNNSLESGDRTALWTAALRARLQRRREEESS